MVVVGGGVIGLACAWELTRAGAAVTVLERGEVGGGVSRGNTGWVVPSMTSPLPAPGMVREGVRQLVTRGDAFVLRPSLDPAFVRWLWRFWRSSSSARFDAGVRALLALNRRTLELFDAYRDAGIRFEMHSTGLLIVARTLAGLHHYAEVFRRLRELGYEGGAARPARPRRRRRARARTRSPERRSRPARARRPLRSAGGADRRTRRQAPRRGRADRREAARRPICEATAAAGRSRLMPETRTPRRSSSQQGSRPPSSWDASAPASRSSPREATASRFAEEERLRAMRSTSPRRSSA